MKPRKPGSGGRRIGAGRPTTGRTTTQATIHLTPPQWAKLDNLRRGLTRSKWIAEKIEETNP